MNRAEVRELHRNMKSWRKVGRRIGIPARTAWRYAMTDYEPKRYDLREALGLKLEARVDYIRQERDKNGRFK